MLATLEEVLLLLRPAADSQAVLLSIRRAARAPAHLYGPVCDRAWRRATALRAQRDLRVRALFFFQVLEEDPVAAGRAIAQLGAALLPGGDPDTYDALGQFARHCQARQDLVVNFAQAHGILDLAPDDYSRFLVETLVREQGRVVLSPVQDQAYGRLSQRFLDLQLNHPLARFLFRGGVGERKQRGS